MQLPMNVDTELKQKISDAAKIDQRSISSFIRKATEDRANQILKKVQI